MDGPRIDRLARSFATGLPRRGVLRLLVGALAGGVPTMGVEGVTAETLPCGALCTLIDALYPGTKATCTKACKIGDSLVDRYVEVIEALVKKGLLTSGKVVDLLAQLFKRGVLDAKQFAAVVERLVKRGVLTPTFVLNFLVKLFKNEILTLKQFTALLKELVKQGVVKLCGGDVARLCIAGPDQIACCDGPGLCENGKCLCPTGKTPCGGACYGACGANEVRDPAKGCACVCKPGRERCDGVCVGIKTNADHCGGCNKPCKITTCVSSAVCENGFCSKTVLPGCCVDDGDCGPCERCSVDHKCVADAGKDGGACPVDGGTGTCCGGGCVGCDGGSVDLGTCSCVGDDGCVCTLKANDAACAKHDECCSGFCWSEFGGEPVCSDGESGCAGLGAFCSGGTGGGSTCCTGLCENCQCVCRAPRAACASNQECCDNGLCTQTGCCLTAGTPATDPADCCSGAIDADTGQCAQGGADAPCRGDGDCLGICCGDRCCDEHLSGYCDYDTDPAGVCTPW